MDDDSIECHECEHFAVKDEDGFYCCTHCDWIKIDENLTTWGSLYD